jgi:hypothetical protein
MADYMNDLVGSTCEAVVRQECWYQGEKTDDVSVLFLKVRDGKWHRIFFDCSPLFWNEVDELDKHEAFIEDFDFPQVEVGHQHGVVGQVIEQVDCVHEGQWPELHIRFSGGTTLVLQDCCEYQLLEFRSDISVRHLP